MKATKLIPGLKALSYGERMNKFKLPGLLYRRAREDIIESYKILVGI